MTAASDFQPEPSEARILRLATELDAAHAELQARNAELQVSHDAERRTRLALLRIHAWMSVTVGVVMALTGTAQIFENQYGNWTRVALGGLACSAGVTLAYGVDGHRARRYLHESVGLILVGAWDAIMCAGFVVSAVKYGHLVVRWPWDLGDIDPLAPRLYGPVIYFGLAAMVSTVHLRAVLRDRRSR